jgi:hypothetical protein
MLKKLALSFAEGPTSFVLASLRGSTTSVRFASSLAAVSPDRLFEQPYLHYARGGGHPSNFCHTRSCRRVSILKDLKMVSRLKMSGMTDIGNNSLLVF